MKIKLCAVYGLNVEMFSLLFRPIHLWFDSLFDGSSRSIEDPTRIRMILYNGIIDKVIILNTSFFNDLYKSMERLRLKRNKG